MLTVLALVFAACSGGESVPTTTVPPTTLPPTTATTTTTTTIPPTTTTTEAPLVSMEIAGRGDFPTELEDLVSEFYSWLLDGRNQRPPLPETMETLNDLVSEDVRQAIQPTGGSSFAAFADATIVELPTEDKVAVIEVEPGDTVLGIEDDAGWRLVGANIRSLLLPASYGPAERFVLVIGSDARRGQNQLRFRADSIHVITLVPETPEGVIMGFPRDSWVDSSVGKIKFTNLMASRGPEIMLETTQDLTGLPLEGYVVTGFKGFEDLIKALGGLEIDLPQRVPSGNPEWASYPAGLQTLSATLALRLARIRKSLPRGDFDRSFNQGLIIMAALAMLQPDGVQSVPGLLELLLTHTWTDLSSEDLLTWAVAAFETDPEDMLNFVLPGRAGSTAGGQSVVFLDDSVEAIFRDLDDGLLDETDLEG